MSAEVRIEDGKIVATTGGGILGKVPDGYYRLIPPEESRLREFEQLEYHDPEEILREEVGLVAPTEDA